MPTITEDIFRRTLRIDYGRLHASGEALAQQLTAAFVARVTTPAGTSLRLSLRDRTARNDDGQLQQPGKFGNLPAGEAYIAPIETDAHGVLVIDGSIAGYGRVHEPAEITIRDGRAIAADGDAGAWLLQTLDTGNQFGRSVAELGIGTNPAAIITGNVLEDEKAIGTIHIAFGTSSALGGVNAAGVHIDTVILQPTVELDRTCIIDQGQLQA
jgi:leucyl aminopeptidase (aminopeptidase T)